VRYGRIGFLGAEVKGIHVSDVFSEDLVHVKFYFVGCCRMMREEKVYRGGGGGEGVKGFKRSRKIS
jgi:hypothetical protein